MLGSAAPPYPVGVADPALDISPAAGPGRQPTRPQAPRRAVTASVVAAVGLLTVVQFSASVGHGSRVEVAVDAVAGAVALAAVPFLLARPVPVALALAPLAGLAPTATPVATFAVLYVARQCRFRVALLVAGAGAATHTLRGLWRPIEGLPLLWWIVLTLVAHATLVGWGAYAQARQGLLLSLQERAERAEAEQARRVAEARAAERARLAREMHDVLAHRLSLVATYAGALEYRPDRPPEQLAQAAGVVRAGVHQALDELRAVIGLLRHDDDGDGALRPLPTLADLPVLVAESRAAGMDVDLEVAAADLPALPPATGRTAYRVVQEAMTNARRHAPGQPVRVLVTGGPGTVLEVDVCNERSTAGAEASGAGTGTGTGLIGLAERVALAGGELVQQATDRSFRLRARLPWPV